MEKVENGNTSTDVISKTVAQFEDGDPAMAIASLVQETDTEERKATLKAVVDRVTSDEMTREEKREVFLIRRRALRLQAKKHLAQTATQLTCDSRR